MVHAQGFPLDGLVGTCSGGCRVGIAEGCGGWCESEGTGLLCRPSGARCFWAVVCSTHPWRAAIVLSKTLSEGDFDPVLLLV